MKTIRNLLLHFVMFHFDAALALWRTNSSPFFNRTRMNGDINCNYDIKRLMLRISLDLSKIDVEIFRYTHDQ